MSEALSDKIRVPAIHGGSIEDARAGVDPRPRGGEILPLIKSPADLKRLSSRDQRPALQIAFDDEHAEG